MKLSFTNRIRRSGDSWVVTVPSVYVDNGLLNEGEFITCRIEEVSKEKKKKKQ